MDALNRNQGRSSTVRTQLNKPVTLGGVGKNTQQAHESVCVPTVVNGHASEYKAIEIPDSDVPALLGMETLKRMGAILDLRKNKLIIPKQNDHVQIKFATGTHIIDLVEAPGGYLMIPCSPPTGPKSDVK